MSGLPAQLAAELAAVPGVGVAVAQPLAPLVSIGVGGPADVFCTVATHDGLRAVLDRLAGRGVPWLLIGRGTNVLPDDAGFRGAVLRLEGAFSRAEVGDGWIEAGAAAGLAVLVERAMTHDQGGLEFTTGIPGCVGGSLVGNAGTAEEALGDRVERVDVVAPGGAARALGPAELKFAYRTSALKALGAVVTGARFRLEPRLRADVAARVRTYTAKRRDQPLAQPNVGCIFKNPPGDSAGRLIDRAGLKGSREGRVEVSAKHANFMVNLGGASAAEVRALIRRVRERVREVHGVLLEPEVVALDDHGRPASLEPSAVC